VDVNIAASAGTSGGEIFGERFECKCVVGSTKG